MSVSVSVCDEVLTFTESAKIISPLVDADLFLAFKSHQKQIRSLLIWHNVLETNLQSQGSLSAGTVSYSEAISDVVQSLYLWSQNLNRPSLMMIRSSSDQIIHALSEKYKIDTENNLRISEKISALRKLYNSGHPAEAICSGIGDIYRTSSQIVHASDPIFQNVGSCFVEIVKFRKSVSDTSIKVIGRYLKLLNGIIYLEHHSLMGELSYKQKDIILDSLTKLLKKYVNS